jgi:hypothetical protein
VEVLDHKLDVLRGALAVQGADDQAAARVQGDVVPAVAAVIVGGVAGVAVLLFLADERPLLVELDLAC